MAINICKQCKKEFNAPPSYNRKFCGRSCATTYKNLHNNPMWNEHIRKKAQESLKGNVPWQKVLGNDHPKVILYKYRMAKLQSKRQKGKKAWNKGLTKKENPDKVKYGLFREKNPMWKGGPSKRDYRDNYKEWMELRLSILERDNYTCQNCGLKKTKGLHVHHIIPWRESKNNEKSNLLTLCNYCHKD